MTKILQALRAGQVMMNSEIQKYQQEQWFNNVQPKCSKTSSLLYSCRPVVAPRQYRRRFQDILGYLMCHCSMDGKLLDLS
jgi:hypothetical protein